MNRMDCNINDSSKEHIRSKDADLEYLYMRCTLSNPDFV